MNSFDRMPTCDAWTDRRTEVGTSIESRDNVEKCGVLNVACAHVWLWTDLQKLRHKLTKKLTNYKKPAVIIGLLQSWTTEKASQVLVRVASIR